MAALPFSKPIASGARRTTGSIVFFCSFVRQSHTSQQWDVYFSCDDGLELHAYVCVALLREMRDTLLELDGEAIGHALARLPSVDVGQIVAQADNLRREAENSLL